MATFTDDFNRANSPNPGTDWDVESGTWAINANRLRSELTTESAIRCVQAAQTQDHSVQVTVAAVAGSAHPNVIARMTDAGTAYDGYRFRWANVSGGQWQLQRVDAGVASAALDTAVQVQPSVPYTLRIECEGSDVRGLYNGVEVVSIVDATHTAGRFGGVRTNTSALQAVDNYEIEDFAVAPTADAGPDQSVTNGELVELDGSASTAGSGSLSYAWTHVSGPFVGALTGPTSATPSYTPTQTGTDIWALEVTNTGGLTATDQVSVGVEVSVIAIYSGVEWVHRAVSRYTGTEWA